MSLGRDFREIWLVLDDAGHRLLERVAFVDARAAEHLVKHQSESINVSSLVNLFPLGLLRCHVSGRSQYDARCSLTNSNGGRFVGLSDGHSTRLRQSEIEYFDDAVRTDLDIAGFQ